MKYGVLTFVDQKVLEVVKREDKPLRSQEIVRLVCEQTLEEGLNLSHSEINESVLRLLSLRELDRDDNWCCILGQPYKPIHLTDKQRALKQLGFVSDLNQDKFVSDTGSMFTLAPFYTLKQDNFEQRIHYAKHITAEEAIQEAILNLQLRLKGGFTFPQPSNSLRF